MTTQRKPALATRVSPVVDNAVRKLTNALGITISEYMRKLILDDLESKGMFDGQFRKTIEKSAIPHKESPQENIRKLFEQSREEENHETLW